MICCRIAFLEIVVATENRDIALANGSLFLSRMPRYGCKCTYIGFWP